MRARAFAPPLRREINNFPGKTTHLGENLGKKKKKS
jgi:hypothetical protein